MILKKEKCSNNLEIRKYFKILMIFVFFLSFFGFKSFAENSKHEIYLPQKIDGVEKIEYFINGEAKGTTSGENKITVEEDSELQFLIKFDSAGYKQLRAGDIKILSDRGADLPLNVYKYDFEGDVITSKTLEDEFIDSKQTYVTTPRKILKDEKFYISGIKIDTHTISLSLPENTNISEISDAVEISFTDETEKHLNRTVNSREFIIEGVEDKSSLRIKISLNEAYSKSEIKLYSENSDFKFENNEIYIPYIIEDRNFIVDNLSKNEYDLNFDSSLNFKSLDNSDLKGISPISYGEDFSFTFDSDDILSDKEVTSNGVAIRKSNGVYTLKNISENKIISIKNKEDSSYNVSFESLKGIEKVKNLSDEFISSANVKYGESFSFKTFAEDAYTQNEEKILLYAVPEEFSSKNIEELSNYLLTPDSNGIYKIYSVDSPIKVLVSNEVKNTYEISFPDRLNGASYEILKDDKISENKCSVTHGDEISLKINPEEGYDISDLIFVSDKGKINFHKNENIYTLENITSSSNISIRNINVAKRNLNLNGTGIYFTDENGNEISGPQSMNYYSGEFKFSVKLKEGYEIKNNEINFNISSGDVKIEKISENLYVAKSMKENSEVNFSGAEIKKVTVKLTSENDDLKFVNAESENEILPNEKTLEYGSDFKFKIYSSQGKDENDLKVESLKGTSVVKDSSLPMTYNLNGVSGNTEIYVSENSVKSNSLIDTGLLELPLAAKNFELLTKPEGILKSNFLNSGLNENKTEKIYYKNSENRFYISNSTFRFKTGSENGNDDIFSADDGYEINIYTDKNLTNKLEKNVDSRGNITFLAENGKEAGIKISSFDKSEGVHYSTLEISEFEGDTDSNVKKEDIFFGEDGKGGTTGRKTAYGYQTLYVTIEPTPLKNFKIVFPETTEGYKFYNLLVSGKEISKGNELKSESGKVTVNVDSSEFNFGIWIKEGYNFDQEKGVTLINDEKYYTLSDYSNVDMIYPGEIDTAYKIKNVYSKTLEVKAPDVNIKNFTALFTGTGTNFYTCKLDENNEILSDEVYEITKDENANRVASADYGNDLYFFVRPTTGYQSEVDNLKSVSYELTSSINNESYSVIVDSPSENEFKVAGVSNLKIGFRLYYKYATFNKEKVILFKMEDIKSNASFSVTRSKNVYNLTFVKNSMVSFYDVQGDEIFSVSCEYANRYSFIVRPLSDQYDVSNITVYANGVPLEISNGRYTIKNISENIKIQIDESSVGIVNKTITFTPYDDVKYLDSEKIEISDKAEIPYAGNFEFYISLGESVSESNVTVYIQDSDGVKTPLNPVSKKYTINNIDRNYRIILEGVELNKYSLQFTPLDGLKYYNEYETEELTTDVKSSSEIIKKVDYGESFSFKVIPDEGIDNSELKVWVKTSAADRVPVELIAVNGVYTVENIKNSYYISVEGAKSVKYQVEIRTLKGVSCIDSYGNSISSPVTVSHGESLSFKLSIDNAYNKSNPTVEIKGSTNTLLPNSSGIYTLENITENKILEITNVTKNTYRITFEKTEGVIYKTVKNKEFTDYLDVEYGDSLEFKISLLDAYDDSVPTVILNDREAVAGSGGIYSVSNIQSDGFIKVDNVVKNSEEVAMEDILTVPSQVSSSEDVERVAKATNSYESLSDEQKSLVTNLEELLKAQESTSDFNHTEDGVVVTGVDWNIKLIVEPLNDDTDAIEELNNQLDRKELLNLYEIKLYNILTDEYYEVPYGQKISVSMPCPDVSKYENLMVVHENSGGGIEYLDANISDGIVSFKTASFSRFGVAGKKIPNYAENPSDIAISVSDLVKDEDELKSLLGEGLSSELGNLINSDDVSKSSDNNDENNISNGSDEETNSENGFKEKIYNWLIENELLAVIIIIVLGILIISFIIWKFLKKSK